MWPARKIDRQSGMGERADGAMERQRGKRDAERDGQTQRQIGNQTGRQMDR